jgi:GNAT superfamily N-acetyltransferase
MSKKLPGRYTVSTDPRRLDLKVVYGFLRSSYWAKGRPRRAIKKSIENSFCFAVYQGEEQVAFARVITDFAVFAYLADVFVVSKHQGRGVAQKMLGAILTHPRLRKIPVFQLATRDAHQLYAKFGFKPLAEPERQMKRILPARAQPRRKKAS